MSNTGTEVKNLRLDGVYPQRQEGFFMQRVKLPAGVISSEQARIVARTAEKFGRGIIHLTTRGSMEIHWLLEPDLPEIKLELTRAGLATRGACGGAVRGVTCGSQGVQGYPVLESMARMIHRHFTGNPRFESLPKKFKIGIEADVAGGRHLIQDVGLVLARLENDKAWYDVWVAGGLGREPRAAYLLESGVSEERIIPVIEAVLKVYVENAPPPKRLKYLAAQLGEGKLSQLIKAEPVYSEELPQQNGLPETVCLSEKAAQLIVPVFAGQLTSAELSEIADISDKHANGILIVSCDQDILLFLKENISPELVVVELKQAGIDVGNRIRFRICPGNHECLMGLAPLRDIAHEVSARITPEKIKLTWSISGCPNSCTQPQLADVGIVTSRLTAGEDGVKRPRFDVYRRTGPGLGLKVMESLTLDELRHME